MIADNMALIAVIEAKKQKLDLHVVENQGKQSLERLKIQKMELNKNLKRLRQELKKLKQFMY